MIAGLRSKELAKFISSFEFVVHVGVDFLPNQSSTEMTDINLSRVPWPLKLIDTSYIPWEVAGIIAEGLLLLLQAILPAHRRQNLENSVSLQS